MKCAICNNKIDVTFLDKIKGTFIEKKPVCSECQKKYSYEELKNLIKK